MSEILNQFGYTEGKASVKNGDKGHSFSCKLSGTATAGTFVKVKSVTASKVIVVEAITADTDLVFGVVPYESARANSYVDGEMITVMSDYTRIVCEASAAIAAGATVRLFNVLFSFITNVPAFTSKFALVGTDVADKLISVDVL